MTITHTEGIVICSLIFLEDVLKEEGDGDEEGEARDWLLLSSYPYL